MTDLLPPRTPGRYGVAVVCLGNICRSPMAHVVLERLVHEAGLADRVSIVSAGTADWHTGKGMDSRAAATLTSHGYDATRHRAQQLPVAWLAEQDLVLAMDHSNLADIRGLGDGGGGSEGRVRLFREFDPAATDDDREVPDPYYGEDAGFQHVLEMIEHTSAALVLRIADALA